MKLNKVIYPELIAGKRGGKIFIEFVDAGMRRARIALKRGERLRSAIYALLFQAGSHDKKSLQETHSCFCSLTCTKKIEGKPTMLTKSLHKHFHLLIREFRFNSFLLHSAFICSFRKGYTQ